MSIVVHDMNKEYEIKMFHNDVEVGFFFRQLSYSEKSEIVEKTTNVKQGVVIQDMNLSDFLSIKIALLRVEGLYARVPGKKEGEFDEVPYKLSYDKDGRVSDKSLNEIFNTPFEDRLAYTSKHLLEGVPDKIIHPYTKQEIEGVKIIQPSGGMPKK